jgi:hypothetical protein
LKVKMPEGGLGGKGVVSVPREAAVMIIYC